LEVWKERGVERKEGKEKRVNEIMRVDGNEIDYPFTLFGCFKN